jgi:hypothetical protein
MSVQNHPCPRGRTILRAVFEKSEERIRPRQPDHAIDLELPQVLPAWRRTRKTGDPSWSTVA